VAAALPAFVAGVVLGQILRFYVKYFRLNS
jgi:hypothetical protein